MFVPIVANWNQPPRVHYAFQTNIFASQDGIERREARRTTPRRVLDFITWPEHHGLVRDLILRRVSTTPYRIADFSAVESRTVSAMVPGGMVVAVDSVPDWMAPGARVALVHKRHATELTVLSVGTTPPAEGTGFPYSLPMSFTSSVPVLRTDGFPYALPMSFTPPGAQPVHYLRLSLPTGRHWPVDTQILPVVEGFFDQSTFAAQTDSVFTGAVQFAVLPGSEELPPPAPAPGLNGREALVIEPDWTNPLGFDYREVLEFVDYGRGVLRPFDPVTFRGRILNSVYRERGAETRAFIDFWCRQKGRRGEFYRPTWTADLQMAEDVPPGALTVKVDDPVYALQYGDLKTYPAVAVVRNDGSVQLCYLTGMASHPGQTWLGVDGTAFPNGLTRAEVDRICWVSLCRFASDELTVAWHTRDHAEMAISVAETPEMPADSGLGLLDNASLWILAMFGESALLDFEDQLQRIVNVEYPEAVGQLG